MRSSISRRSTSWLFMCTQAARRSLMWRIHLPVFTDRSPISSKTGSGARVGSAGSCFVRVRQARPGRPLIIMPQLPQMPARQTKSNCSEGSCVSRISLSAMNSVMLSVSSRRYGCMRGVLPGSCGLYRRMCKVSVRGVSSPAMSEPLVDAFVLAAEPRRQAVLVWHERLLHREAPGRREPLSDGVDLFLSRRGVRVVDVVLGPVAAPARWQLHCVHVERLVGQGRQRVVLVAPARQRALEPFGVVAAGMV